VCRLVWFVFLLAAVRAQAGDGQPFSLGGARSVRCVGWLWDQCFRHGSLLKKKDANP